MPSRSSFGNGLNSAAHLLQLIVTLVKSSKGPRFWDTTFSSFGDGSVAL